MAAVFIISFIISLFYESHIYQIIMLMLHFIMTISINDCYSVLYKQLRPYILK